MRKVVALLLVAGFVAGACGAHQAGAKSGKMLKVVATTTQLTDFTRVIAGSRADVYDVVKANVDAHDFEPSPADIEAIRDADVIYVLRMQSERMQPGANFVPSLREYAARWGITPERVRPGQKVMHPGPMNRGVEIDGRVADSADSLIEQQVRYGLVVRMAALYDVLTGGPVGVRALAAAEVA